MFSAEITIPAGWLILISLILFVTIYSLRSNSKTATLLHTEYFDKYKEIEKQQAVDKAFADNLNNQIKRDYENKLSQAETLRLTSIHVSNLNFEQKEIQLKLDYQNWAHAKFEEFKNIEIERIKAELKTQSIEYSATLLQQWKIEAEAQIRQDAINRSYSVNLGKITEHLIPFHQVFLAQFNPRDARFLGSPIDLIVFDGYTDKRPEITIYFVEVKTGKSKLSDGQKRIRQAVQSGNIRWAEINPDNLSKSSPVFNTDNTY